MEIVVGLINEGRRGRRAVVLRGRPLKPGRTRCRAAVVTGEVATDLPKAVVAVVRRAIPQSDGPPIVADETVQGIGTVDEVIEDAVDDRQGFRGRVIVVIRRNPVSRNARPGNDSLEDALFDTPQGGSCGEGRRSVL